MIHRDIAIWQSKYPMNLFFNNNLEIMQQKEHKVCSKSVLEIIEFCNAYCCKPIPPNKKKPVAIQRYTFVLSLNILEILFLSK